MPSREPSALPQIEITMRWSDKVVVVRLGQIGFRCEIKKMPSREPSALPQIEITMRWSDISLLFTTTLCSEHVSRRE